MRKANDGVAAALVTNSRKTAGRLHAPCSRPMRAAIVLAGAAATAALFGAVRPAFAANPVYVWDPSQTPTNPQDGSGSWNTTAGNTVWENGGTDVVWPNSTGADATFGNNNGAAGNVAVSAVTVGNLNFLTPGSGNYTLSGGTITVGAGDTITASAAGTSGINSAILSSTAAGGIIKIAGTQNLTIGGNIGSSTSNYVSLELTGSGTLSVSGNNFIQGGSGGSTGTTAIVQTGTFQITGGTTSTTGSNGNFDIGLSSGTTSGFNMTGGTLNETGSQFVIGAHGSTTTATQSNGTLNIGGTFYAGGYGASGTPSTSTYTLSGGAINLTSGGGGIDFGGGGANSATFNLNGGIFTTGYINTSNSTNTSIFHFNGGTLTASQSNGTFISGLSTVDVSAGGGTINSQAFSVTIPQNLGHNTGTSTDGGLTKIGSGTLTLSGTNTFNGGLNISAGTLAAGAAANIPSSGPLSISPTSSAGAAFTATGTATFTTSALTLNGTTGTATLNLQIGNAGAQSSIVSTNAASTSGAIQLNVVGNPGTSPSGTYNLVSSANGGLNNGTITLAFLNDTNFSAPLSTTANLISITATQQTPLTNAYWKGGLSSGNNVWALSNSTTGNWTSDSAGNTPSALVPGTGALVNFSAGGATNQSSTVLGAPMAVAGIAVNSGSGTVGLVADGNTLTIGSQGITVSSGAGAATFAPTAITLGAPQSWLNNSSALLTVSAPTVTNGGNLLTTDGSGATTFSGSLNGTGGLTKNGAGTLNVTGNNSAFTGNVIINQGIVNVSGGLLSTNVSASALGNPSTANRTLTVGAATVNFTQHDVFGNAASTVVLQTIVNGGTLTSDGHLITMGSITLNAGTMTVANGATDYGFALGSTVTATGGTSTASGPTSAGASGYYLSYNTAATTFDVANGSTLQLSGIVKNAWSGNASGVTKTDSGTMVLSGPNIYTGTTTVTGGSLLINGTNSVSGSGGSYVVGGSAITASATLGGTGTFHMAATKSLTVSGNGTASGVVSPGTSSSIGTLTVDSTSGAGSGVVFGANATLAITSGASGTDLLNITGSGGSLSLTPASDTLALTSTAAGSYTIVQYPSNSLVSGSYFGIVTENGSVDPGAYSNGVWISNSGDVSVNYNASSIVLNVNSVPEPTCVGLFGIVSVGLLVRRRRRVTTSSAIETA